MSRIKRMSPALVVAVLALVAALVVPAIAQVATKALNGQEVRVVRKVSALQANRAITRRAPRIAQFQANRRITQRAPGLDVDKVDGRDAGDFTAADAVLFAYIQDTADPSVAAALGYGDGAVSVDDPDGDNDTVDPYVVTFERNLSGCVAIATSGRGDPAGPGTGAFVGPAFATILGATVEVVALSSAGSATDTSFMLSVLC